MTERIWYSDYQEKLAADKEEQERPQTPEHSFDMDNPPTQGHNWIDRGLKYSCEGAGHPYHQSYKRGVVKQTDM